MRTEMLIKAASASNPEIFTKIARYLELTEALVPACATETALELNTVAESAAAKYNDFKKTASMPAGSQVALAAGGMVAAGILGSVATDMYDAAKRGLTKARDFRAIMRANPEINQLASREDINRAYDSLHRFGPEFTADPGVGGALLGALARDRSLGPTMVQNMLASRKALTDSKSKSFMPGTGQLKFKGPDWDMTTGK